MAGIAQAALGLLLGQLLAPWDRLHQQFGNLQDDLSPVLQRALYQQCVPSAGSCACEVWGLRRLRDPATQAREQVAQSVVQLWWQLTKFRAGVAGSTVVVRVGHAVARDGLVTEHDAVEQRAGGTPAGSLHRAVALLDWSDAVNGQVKNWAWSMFGKVCDLCYHLPFH